MNFICADAATASSPVVTYVILGVLLVAMLVFPYFTQKKRNKQYVDMISAIKVGDLVKTAGGIIGRITKITDKGDIKTVILETGSKTEKSYMEFDITSIYCVLKSTKVEDAEKEEKVEEPAKDETVEDAEKTEQQEQKPEEKPAKKTSTKKSSTKKTSSKK